MDEVADVVESISWIEVLKVKRADVRISESRLFGEILQFVQIYLFIYKLWHFLRCSRPTAAAADDTEA